VECEDRGFRLKKAPRLAKKNTDYSLRVYTLMALNQQLADAREVLTRCSIHPVSIAIHPCRHGRALILELSAMTTMAGERR